LTAIAVRGLDRRFGSTRVLRSLDLEVDAGDHVTVTGANGSGKTTLLRVLAGLLRPTSGAVCVLGGEPGDPRVRGRIGIVGHAPGLYARMTAMENLRFWAAMYGDSSLARCGAEVLARLGLDPGDTRPVSAYSQGMRRRVSVARALAPQPDLLLADEPFAGVDAAGADALTTLMRDIETVVVATHERTLPGRTLALRNGRLHGA
jgi:heme ABC exporter ATP-binding subunit CcmA